MTFPVPLEAARLLAKANIDRDYNLSDDEVSRIGELIEFAERFETVALPGMKQETVAGELREIHLADESLDAQSFDLIRLNGRVFAPEVIEVEDDDFDPALFPALPSVGEISNALRWLAPLQADDARKTLLEIAAGRLDASVDFPEPKPLPAAPTVLHVAGNGHALTTATVEMVAQRADKLSAQLGRAGLWHASNGSRHGETIDGAEAAEAIDDGVRLIRFLVDIVLAEMGRAPVSPDNSAHKLAAARMTQAFGIGREVAEEALRTNAPARAIFDAAVSVIAELIEDAN